MNNFLKFYGLKKNSPVGQNISDIETHLGKAFGQGQQYISFDKF